MLFPLFLSDDYHVHQEKNVKMIQKEILSSMMIGQLNKILNYESMIYSYIEHKI